MCKCHIRQRNDSASAQRPLQEETGHSLRMRLIRDTCRFLWRFILRQAINQSKRWTKPFIIMLSIHVKNDKSNNVNRKDSDVSK